VANDHQKIMASLSDKYFLNKMTKIHNNSTGHKMLIN